MSLDEEKEREREGDEGGWRVPETRGDYFARAAIPQMYLIVRRFAAAKGTPPFSYRQARPIANSLRRTRRGSTHSRNQRISPITTRLSLMTVRQWTRKLRKRRFAALHYRRRRRLRRHSDFGAISTRLSRGSLELIVGQRLVLLLLPPLLPLLLKHFVKHVTAFLRFVYSRVYMVLHFRYFVLRFVWKNESILTLK